MRSNLFTTALAFIFITLGAGKGHAQSDSTDNTVFGKLARRRVMPMVYYSNPDHVFAGVRVRIAKGRIRQDSNGMLQSIQFRYSISQNAFSVLYDGRFNHLLGNWNVGVNGSFDWVVWTNYFGPGNDTRRDNSLPYYRLSTSEYAGSVNVNRVFNKYNYVEFSANIQGVEVLNKPGTFIADNYIHDPVYYYEHHIYAGPSASYTYQRVDDPMVPTRGVMFYAGGGYVVNVNETNKSFAKGNVLLQVYVPMVSKFSLSLRAGGAAISGTPEFYQYVSVGGPMTIRGYYRDRFWGKESFYNTNELRYITDFRMRKVYGKIGFLALFDDGRVWIENENSTTIHYGYGGGLLLAPFNKFTGMLTYAVSPEGGIVQVKVTKLLTQVQKTRTGL